MEDMKKTVSVLFLLVGFLFLTTTTIFCQKLSGQLFEKALYAEEVEGELQQAIDLYKKLLKNIPVTGQMVQKHSFTSDYVTKN